MSPKQGVPRADNPPWGHWEVLIEAPGYKVKRLVVAPGKRLSYQRHSKRQEHWVVVEGAALVIIDGRETALSQGESIDIPRKSAHRVENRGTKDLVFIEIQSGDYLGEDDIVRLEDDFGRAGDTARDRQGESGQKKR